MKRRGYQQLILIIFLAVLIVLPIAVQAKNEISNFLETAGSLGGYVTENIDQTTLFVAVGIIAQVLLAILGVVFVALIIYGGYIWMLARGNEDEVSKGKSIIIDATIGLILVLSAAVISNFVLSNLF